MRTKCTAECQPISFEWETWQKLGKVTYYCYPTAHMREAMPVKSVPFWFNIYSIVRHSLSLMFCRSFLSSEEVLFLIRSPQVSPQ